MAAERAPDVFIVVLDAVRSADVYSDKEGEIRGLPFLSRFVQEAAVFPQAAAVAPWTLPSVATLMTGLYPWEHGVSALGTQYLDSRVPTLATILCNSGYSTVLLSANNLVGPRTNLSAGFERTYVADWWEQYLRVRRATPGSMGATVGEPTSDRPTSNPFRHLRMGVRRGMRLGFRFPGMLERASELAQRLRNPGNPPGVSVSPWIEPTLHKVLTEIPRSRPVFCVVHLNDAHEPYFRPANGVGNGASNHTPMVRQDYMRRIEGRWTPTEEELAAAHTLYRGMIRSLDHRIEELVTEFSELRDIDGALVLITADHGQAFGEGGWLFHMSSSEEAVLRVPLIVRFPHAALTGRGKGWASTVDIFSTVLEATGLHPSMTRDNHPLQTLFEKERPTPAWALGDGLPLRHLTGIVSIPLALRERVASRLWLAAYEGPLKLVYDFTTHKFNQQRVDVSHGTEACLSESELDEGRSRIRAETMRLAEVILRCQGDGDSEEVLRRLGSWGYVA